MRLSRFYLSAVLLLALAAAAWAPPAARVGDLVNGTAHQHGPVWAPRPVRGPVVTGSPNVFVNGKPAARVDDSGTHAACDGPNAFRIVAGSRTVLINGKPAARVGDATLHCGVAPGAILQGSPDVLIGD